MKNNILYVSLIITLINFSCNSKKEYTFSQIKNSSSGYLIKDSLIVKEIDKLINDNKLKIISEEFISIIISIELSLENGYNLEISTKDFNIEKQNTLNRNLKEYNYKGYMIYKNHILLLFGDENDFFEKNTKETVKNIFYIKRKIENEKIRIVYDPPILKYKISNGKLIFVSGF